METKPMKMYSNMHKIYRTLTTLIWVKYLKSVSTQEFFDTIISNYNLWKAGIHISRGNYDEFSYPFLVKIIWSFFSTLEYELNYRNLGMAEYVENLHRNIKDISEILAEIDIRYEYMKNIGIPEMHNMLKMFYPKVASAYLERIKEDLNEIIEYLSPDGGENNEKYE